MRGHVMTHVCYMYASNDPSPKPFGLNSNGLKAWNEGLLGPIACMSHAIVAAEAHVVEATTEVADAGAAPGSQVPDFGFVQLAQAPNGQAIVNTATKEARMRPLGDVWRLHIDLSAANQFYAYVGNDDGQVLWCKMFLHKGIFRADDGCSWYSSSDGNERAPPAA